MIYSMELSYQPQFSRFLFNPSTPPAPRITPLSFFLYMFVYIWMCVCVCEFELLFKCCCVVCSGKIQARCLSSTSFLFKPVIVMNSFLDFLLNEMIIYIVVCSWQDAFLCWFFIFCLQWNKDCVLGVDE